jgi:hypothetical protein
MRFLFLHNCRALIVVYIFFGCTQKKQNGLLSLVLENKELQISHVRERLVEPCSYNCTEIKFKLVNTSDENILLYNFNRHFEHGEFSENFFCDSVFLAAERSMYVTKSNGELMPPTGALPDSVHGEPISIIKRQMDLSKTWFRNSKQVIKKGETIEFSKKINLRDFYLVAPGVFYLKLLYYQHDVLRELTQEEIESDLREYDAYLFKGCLWSNSVKLIVE